MDKKLEPILEVDLGENGGKIVFTNIDDIQQWVSKERGFWQWFQNESRNDQQLRELWGRIGNSLSGIEQPLNAGRQFLNEPGWRGHLSNLKQRIVDCYQGGGHNALPHSRSTKARFIEDLRVTAPLAAAYATAYFMGSNSQPVQAIAFRGIISAYLFNEGLLKKGVQENAKAEISALRDLRVEWDGAISTLKTDAAALQNQFVDLKENAKILLDEQAKAHTLLITKQDAEFLVAIDKGEKKLKEIGDAYDSFMVLQAPVTYWEGEEQKHQLLAKGYGARSAIFGVVALVAIALTIWTVVGEETAVGKIPLWRIGALLAVVTGVVWIERILVRMYLSHSHLSTDAGERVAMAKTYLALVRDGKVTDDKDRRVILEALFRKATTGIVKDDGAPPSVIEAFTRQR